MNESVTYFLSLFVHGSRYVSELKVQVKNEIKVGVTFPVFSGNIARSKVIASRLLLLFAGILKISGGETNKHV